MSLFTSLPAKLTPRVVVPVVVVIVLLTGAGTAFTIINPQRAAPDAIRLNLKDGETEVHLDHKLSFTLPRPVAAVDFEPALGLVPAVPGTVQVSPDGRTATFTPAAPWADHTDYRVLLKTFKDRAGKPIPAASWRFQTTIVPRVAAVTGAGGVPLAAGAQIPLESVVTVEFNAPMDGGSVKIAINDKAAATTWLPDGKSATVATTGIPAGPLTIAVAAGRDRQGHVGLGNFLLELRATYQNPEKTVPLKYPALIQIDNVQLARDQSGLQAAEIVFEYQTEGGITRFTGVFGSSPPNVGPIRSGRYISFKLVRHYHGALFLSGLSGASFHRLLTDEVPVFFDAPYYRSRDRLAPENLYITSEGLQSAVADSRPAPFEIAHGEPALPATSPAGTALSVPEHQSNYAYDAPTGTYLKTQEGHLMSDALLSQPLHIAMVVVMHTREFVTSDIEDGSGARARDFETEAGGKAEFYYFGRMATGTWSGASRTDPFVFKLATGEVVALPKGLTWIDVVG